MRTKGLEERQFLYCDDFSAGIYTVFENYSRFANSDKCIDISNFQWVSIRTIATIIADIAAEKLGKTIEIKDGDGIDTFQVGPRNEPAISELNSLWNPVVSLREGISSIFDSILQSKTE
jgi:nucleoside-diphosphate-sugar epimerase